MATLRDFFGTPCPACAKDILQPAPQVTRMPRNEAHCPTCKSDLTLEQLLGARQKKAGSFGGMMRRLFGKSEPGSY
ncbi:MAG TPA: hypothetical protein VNZ52_04240 [Candidatus Thermoplasmatota archaeon]|nr:hypothetical protein [Candidatus Thermoplasmatota archaeon]